MKIIPKYQAGGDMAGDVDNAPAEQELGGAQDPISMLAQAAQQALQTQDCQMAMQVCEAFLQVVQQMANGGAPELEEQPVYARRGGKLVRKFTR